MQACLLAISAGLSLSVVSGWTLVTTSRIPSLRFSGSSSPSLLSPRFSPPHVSTLRCKDGDRGGLSNEVGASQKGSAGRHSPKTLPACSEELASVCCAKIVEWPIKFFNIAPRPLCTGEGCCHTCASTQVGYVHGGKYQFDQTYNVAHGLTIGSVQAEVR